MKELYDDMLSKGLVSPGTHWLERAVEEHNPRVTVELANTYPVGILNTWEIWVISQAHWN